MLHEPVSLRQAIREFIHERRSLRRKPKTIAYYRGTLGRFADSLDDDPIAISQALTPRHVRAFFAALDERGVSQDTFAAYDRALRTLSKFCLAEGYIETDPMASRPRARQARNVVPDTLTREEIDALLGTCDLDSPVGLRDRALMLLLLDTGMRAGEICSLPGGRLKCTARRGRITIPAAGAKGVSDRVVMFCPETLLAVDAWLAVRGHPGEADPVFVAVTGRATLTARPLTPGGLNQMMRRRAARAGVTGKRRWCHIWRHTFAKFYVIDGGDLESLRRLLGHASLETVRIYLQFCVQELEDFHTRHSPVHGLYAARNEKSSRDDARELDAIQETFFTVGTAAN